jgi:AraC-like DNA-binding protein
VGYDHQVICERATFLLSRDPRLTLTRLCQSLQVSRHTVTRCLRERGLTVRSLQAQYRARRIEEVLRTSNPDLIKQLAGRVGYSPSSFARRLRETFGATPTEVRGGGQRASDQSKW